MRFLYHISFVIALSASLMLDAQNAKNIWYFGNDGAGLDFNLGAPISSSLPNISSFFTTECASSICDNSGSLLFYTNGQRIWDSTHNIMLNGNSLLGHNSTTQGAIILPLPGSDTIFYLFVLDYQAGIFGNNGGGLSYSIIDMGLNGGLGAVSVSNIPLVTPTAEKITAVRHANGRDIWVTVIGWNDGNIYSYLLDCKGIDESNLVVSNVGTTHIGGPQNQASLGQMKFNHVGTKMALVCEYLSLIEIFDFDNSTGQLSNPISISTASDPYGLEFSPDDTKLYVTSNEKVYQLDLSSNNATTIINSIIQVGTISSSPPISGMQIAPDDNIYISIYGQTYLSVINDPDVLGTNCNFVNNGIDLNGKNAHFGLPNFMKGDYYITLEMPIADYSYGIACINEITSFNDLSSGNIIEWEWDFGDGSSSSDSNPGHIFSNGSFNTSLTIIDECSNQSTSSQTIITDNCQSIFIPNAFSPNNDGINDEFRIRGNGIKELSISIYNRWGEEVFQSTDPDFSWDGLVKNKALDLQVLIINSNITLVDESSRNIKQSLTLVR